MNSSNNPPLTNTSTSTNIPMTWMMIYDVLILFLWFYFFSCMNNSLCYFVIFFWWFDMVVRILFMLLCFEQHSLWLCMTLFGLFRMLELLVYGYAFNCIALFIFFRPIFWSAWFIN
jgi:uncharacterized integral membrane protein